MEPKREWLTREARGALFSQLLEVGLLASRFGKAEETDAIARALESFLPGHPSLGLARALARIYSNRPEEAIPILRERVLAAEPGHPQARAFLGLALHLTGEEERCREVLAGILAEDLDPKAAAFARTLLELSRRNAGAPSAEAV